MVETTLMGYFGVFYNWIDILYLSLNSLLLICTLPQVTAIEEY